MEKAFNTATLQVGEEFMSDLENSRRWDRKLKKETGNAKGTRYPDYKTQLKSFKWVDHLFQFDSASTTSLN